MTLDDIVCNNAILNASQLDVHDAQVYLSGSCVLTSCFLDDSAPYAPTFQERRTNQSKKAGKKKKKKRKQPEASLLQPPLVRSVLTDVNLDMPLVQNGAAHAEAEVRPAAKKRHLDLPDFHVEEGERPGFAAAAQAGRRAMQALLKPNLQTGQAVFKSLLAAAHSMASKTAPGPRLSPGHGKLNAVEVASRSPQHIRFSDEGRAMSAEGNAQPGIRQERALAGALAATGAGVVALGGVGGGLPLAASAVVRDLAAHTVGIGLPELAAHGLRDSASGGVDTLAPEPAAEPAVGRALAIAADVAGAAEEPSVAAGDLPRRQAGGWPDHGDASITTYEMCKKVKLQKYWAQRYSLWSRFDDGVLMDTEGWYSATPEVLARHHADAMCGVGGNAVQLAGTCRQVTAIDTSMERLLLAQHNAGVYGVSGAIDFVCGDFLRLAPRFQADAVFVSPPWGGPGYQAQRQGYAVDRDVGGLGIGFGGLLAAADAALHRPVLTPPRDGGSDGPQTGGRGVAVFLPKATSLAHVSATIPPGRLCEVERNVLGGRLKSVTVYVAPWVADGEADEDADYVMLSGPSLS